MRSRSLVFMLSLFCLLWLAAFPLFAQKVMPVDTSHVDTLRIDPLNSFGGSASEVFKTANYIPLETTKESLFGRIEQLEVTDQYFIILDESTNCILFFKKDGKYSHKINGGSVNVSNENKIFNFKINRWKQELVYFRGSRTGSKYLFYDFKGNKLRELPYDYKTDPELFDYKYISENLLVNSFGYDLDTAKSDQQRQLVSYVKDFKELTARAFPYRRADYKYSDGAWPVYPNFSYAGNDTTFFYVKPMEYDIYKVTPNTLSLTYKMILSIFNSLPKGFITDSVWVDKRQKFIEANKSMVYKLGDCYQMGDNLVFRFYTWDSSAGLSNLIYNLQSGTLIAYDNIVSDEMTFFLPTVERLLTIRGFLACDGASVYSQFSSVQMFRAREEHSDKKIKYSPALEQYFKGSDRDNPVLLQVSFKDKL